VKKVPSDVVVKAGHRARFTATASGSPTPTVQWLVSSDDTTFVDIPGATTTTLRVPATGADNGNQYEAVFSNASGTATTPPATLTVTFRSCGVIIPRPDINLTACNLAGQHLVHANSAVHE